MVGKHEYSENVGIIALVNDVWSDSPFMSRHQILTRLGRYFTVLWCDPSASWHSLVKPGESRKRWVERPSSTFPGFSVYEAEKWLPSVSRLPQFSRLTLRTRLNRAKHILIDKHGCSKIVLYLWNPRFAPALNLVEHDVSCYHIVDEYSFSDTELPFDEVERQLIADVDQVFIHSPGLLEKKGSVNPHTNFVPNGVDYDTFAQPAEEPHDISSIGHPRIGYSGIMKETLDWPLLDQLSEQHLEWQFVFVGQSNPRHVNLLDKIQELSNRPNVHFLGAKTVGELATYAQHFDVCMLPYRLDSHMMRYGYPLKLHEYLASGSPIVGSPIRSLEDFGDVIGLPRTLDEWSKAIRDSLSPSSNSEQKIEMRRNVARQHDWDELVRTVADSLMTRLSR